MAAGEARARGGRRGERTLDSTRIRSDARRADLRNGHRYVEGAPAGRHGYRHQRTARRPPRTAVTDADGAWVVTNLPVGGYSVTAELQGFKRVRRTGFSLSADGRLTADLTLEVGGVG